MKALVHYKYGSEEVLEVGEFDIPTPAENEVLVKVKAAGLNAADRIILTGDPFITRLFSGGIMRPKFLRIGADMAGVVEAVGDGVTEFQPGDAVFGDMADNGWGAIADFVCIPANILMKKPANLSFEQAAAVPLAAVTAWHGLVKHGQVQAGQKVLINGASGGVGTYAVQIAKAFGAEVTAVCSARNADLARELGADFVIDYAVEDFTAGDKKYDLILAANGYHPVKAYQRVLSATGTYLVTGGEMRQMFGVMLLGGRMGKNSAQAFMLVESKPDKEALTALRDLIEAGSVVPVIDTSYSFDAAGDAFKHLIEGPIRGKIVLVQG